MAQNNELPEGTDTVIEGASGASGTPRIDNAAADGGSEALIAGSPTASGAWSDRIRDGRQQLTGQASEKARGLVGQGLERSSEALANVSRMIGDTAAGIDERLGQEYGDYARRAAAAIEDAANSLAAKEPEDLIDDARDFVRKSPGVALAGAAVVGFALARLIKNGLSSSNDDEEESRPPRTTSAD